MRPFVAIAGVLRTAGLSAPEVLAAVARGNQALRDGRPERAMSEYRAALEARPDAPAALLNAALCARLLGDGTSGRRLLERLLPLLDEEDDDRWWVEQVLRSRFERRGPRPAAAAHGAGAPRARPAAFG